MNFLLQDGMNSDDGLFIHLFIHSFMHSFLFFVLVWCLCDISAMDTVPIETTRDSLWNSMFDQEGFKR